MNNFIIILWIIYVVCLMFLILDHDSSKSREDYIWKKDHQRFKSIVQKHYPNSHFCFPTLKSICRKQLLKTKSTFIDNLESIYKLSADLKDAVCTEAIQLGYTSLESLRHMGLVTYDWRIIESENLQPKVTTPKPQKQVDSFQKIVKQLIEFDDKFFFGIND